MVYLKNIHNGIYYICEKVRYENDWHEKCLCSLGRISEEEASELLQLWVFRPTKKYRTVVIDPPWEIEKITRRVRPKQKEMDYPTMNLEGIKNYGIYKLQKLFDEEGCHVYLWTTQKHL